MFYRFRLVIRAPLEHTAIAVAYARRGRRSAHQVIRLTAGWADESTTKPRGKNVFVYCQLDNCVDGLAFGDVVQVECFRLRKIPWESIQDVTLQRIIFREALADPVQNVFVRREVPTRDRFFNLKAELRPAGNVIADDIASRNVWDPVGLREQTALGSLSRARRAKQNDAHYFMKPS